MLKFIVISTLLATSALAQAVPKRADVTPLPLDSAVVTGTLPNGLRYFVRKNSRPAARAELRLVVNAGSLLEDDDQLGLAHFVEHMAFNGTVNFEKHELVDYIERIGMRFGADLNASTSFDETIYQLQVPTDSAHLLNTAMQILEDWAHGVSFDTAEIRKERGVVIEEWRLDQDASNRMFRQQFPVLFRGSRYRDRLPIGTRESLEGFAPGALNRYYRDWYRPDLMAVVAVGDFDVAAVTALIKTHFSKIRSPRTKRPRVDYRIPRRDSTAVAIATDPEATSTSISVYYLEPGDVDPSEAAYRESLVDALYAMMFNARLDELTQRPNPPFLGAGGGASRLVRGTRAFFLGAAVSDTGIARGFEAVLTEAERVERHGFTATELDRAKQDLLRSYERAYAERANTESVRYADEYVRHFLTGEAIPGIGYELALVKRLLPAIELDEVNRAARVWLDGKDRVLLVNAPEKAAAQIPDERALLALFDRVQRAEVAAYEDNVSDEPLVTASLAPRPVASVTTDSLLGVTTWTLPNGIRVVLKPTDFKADEVLLTASSPGGTSVVPDSLYAAATFATQLIGLGGLGDFSAVDLQKKLAGKAVSVSPYIGSYYEGLQGQASPQDLETLFQLIYLQFTAPRRDRDAFEAFKTNARAALANRSANPATAFRDTLTVVLTQHHPRTRPISVAVVDSFDLDRSYRVYRDRFGDAGDFTFVIVGAFTLDAIRPLVETYLGNLPSRQRTEQWRDVGIRPPTGVIERQVVRGLEPRSQTQLVFSGAFPYSREERFVIRSLADVLDLRLRERLREDLGGTYGASVSASPTKVPREEYSISVGFGSAPDRVDELVAAVWAEIDALQRTGATDDELVKLRESTVRTRETSLRENGFWLGQLSGYEQTGEDFRGILVTADLLPLLTAERLKQAAVRYLDRSNHVRVTLVPETGRTP